MCAFLLSNVLYVLIIPYKMVQNEIYIMLIFKIHLQIISCLDNVNIREMENFTNIYKEMPVLFDAKTFNNLVNSVIVDYKTENHQESHYNFSEIKETYENINDTIHKSFLQWNSHLNYQNYSEEFDNIRNNSIVEFKKSPVFSTNENNIVKIKVHEPPFLDLLIKDNAITNENYPNRTSKNLFKIGGFNRENITKEASRYQEINITIHQNASKIAYSELEKLLLPNNISEVLNISFFDIIGNNTINGNQSEIFIGEDGLPASIRWTTGKILMFILQMVIMLETIFGNLMVVISVIMEKKLQTPFNYYILNLAMTDMNVGLSVMSLFTIYNLYDYFPFNNFLCGYWIWSDYTMTFESVMTLAAIR